MMESNGTKQAGHTPGPWQTGARMSRVEAWPDGWRVPLCIADCDAENAPEIEAEKVANARLIASAPYMRFLLEDAARMLPTLTGENLTAYARTFSALANAAIRQSYRQMTAYPHGAPLANLPAEGATWARDWPEIRTTGDRNNE